MAADTGYKEARAISEAAREKDWKLPSFGKGLYLGDFQPDLISPQPEMPAEAVEKGERFMAILGAFLQAQVDPQAIERDGVISDEVVAGFKEIGALGMKVPEEYGGLGLSQVYYNRALMLAGVWHSSVSTLLSAHQSIGLAQPLLLFGSEEQKREWLPKVCKTHLSAFALTEPGVGSDPARVSTIATPTEDGAGYVLNGRKLWTTNGTVADVLVVMAKVPRSEGRRGGITAFIVPSDTDGVEVEARIEFMGLRGIENSQTRYTDVYVPKENVIGKEGQGLKIALATLNTGRLALPAVCAGVCKWATKIAREFASQRVQWGKPIGEHDEVAQRIAFIAATAFGLEAMLDVTSRLADEKRNDVRIEAALAKLYGSEMGWRVVDELMQVCGGRGYETARSLEARGLRGVPVEQALRDMRVNRIFEGSSEIMHLIVAREAMDQHLHVAGDLMDPEVPAAGKAKALGKAGAFYANWYPRLAVGRGHAPGVVWRVRRAGRAHAVRRAHQPQARALHVLRDGTLAGRHRGPRRVPRTDRGHRRRAVRHGGGRGLRPDGDEGAPRAGGGDPGAGRGLLHPGPRAHGHALPRPVEQRRPAQPQAGAGRPQGPAHLAGGGRPRPVRRRRPDGPVGRDRPRGSDRRGRDDERLQHLGRTRHPYRRVEDSRESSRR